MTTFNDIFTRNNDDTIEKINKRNQSPISHYNPSAGFSAILAYQNKPLNDIERTELAILLDNIANNRVVELSGKRDLVADLRNEISEAYKSQLTNSSDETKKNQQPR